MRAGYDHNIMHGHNPADSKGSRLCARYSNILRGYLQWIPHHNGIMNGSTLDVVQCYTDTRQIEEKNILKKLPHIHALSFTDASQSVAQSVHKSHTHTQE